MHPDLPDPGQVQRREDAGAGRPREPAGARAGGGVEGPRRPGQRRWSRASSTSATPTRPRPGTPCTRRAARVYVLAAHAVENAKLLLASGLGGGNGLVGKGLIDHPSLYAWGLSPVPVGAYRGPLSTAGIEDLRGGAFRARHAAFRFDIGNDGWRATTGAPDTQRRGRRRRAGTVRDRAARAPGRDAARARSASPSPSSNSATAPTRSASIPATVDQLGNPRPVISYHIDDYTRGGHGSGHRRLPRRCSAQAGITGLHRPGGGRPGSRPSAATGTVFHYHGMGHFAGTHVMGRQRRRTPWSTPTSARGSTATSTWSAPAASRRWAPRTRR